MEIVINIPKEKYDMVRNKTYCGIYDAVIYKAIANGTVLPKGHGKLFDVNDILDRIGLEDNDANREENVGEIITLEDFDYIPTIIPADTSENGGDK